MANESNPNPETPAEEESALGSYAETIGTVAGTVAKQLTALKEQGVAVGDRLSHLVEGAKPTLDQLEKRVEDQIRKIRGRKKVVAGIGALQPAPLTKYQRRKRAGMSAEARARLEAREQKRQEKWRSAQ